MPAVRAQAGELRMYSLDDSDELRDDAYDLSCADWAGVMVMTDMRKGRIVVLTNLDIDQDDLNGLQRNTKFRRIVEDGLSDEWELLDVREYAAARCCSECSSEFISALRQKLS